MTNSAIWDVQKHAIGIDSLDSAHLEFITQVEQMIRATDAEFPALFQTLIHHTRIHFDEEGRLMREHKYPGLSMHEGEHHRVLGEMQQLNRSLKRGRLPLVRAFVKQGLPEWFDSHLSMMDRALVVHLNKNTVVANTTNLSTSANQDMVVEQNIK